MRKNTKKIAVAGGTVIALTAGGVAFAYWTTTGSGSGTGSTTAGDNAAASVTNDTLSAMYPGDAAQNIAIKVSNTSTTQKVYVTNLAAWVTTNKAGCDGSDFLLNGTAAPSTQATAVGISWNGVEIAPSSTAPTQSANTIQFNNKATQQDACKGATVTVHYLAS